MQLKSVAFILMLTAGLYTVGPRPSHAQTTASTKTLTIPYACSIYGDSLEAVRKGLLMYAVAPLSEQQLKLRDGTANEFSITVPLLVDKAHTNLSIMTRIDNMPVLLKLDTGGGAGVFLDKKTARQVALDHPHLVSLAGISGTETATEGIAHSMRVGSLTLRAVDIIVPHHFIDSSSPCILGLPTFSKYRVTLDFTAKLMTLSRGGTPVAAEKNDAHISLPFHNDDGKIFLPCEIAGQLTWSELDTGCPINFLSIGMAKAVAAQIPAQETISASTRLKFGVGNTYNNTSLMLSKRMVPISVDSEDVPGAFGTTSQIGMSTYQDGLSGFSSIQPQAILGVPFLLQYHRVIIDYPNHMLILQGLKHGASRNVYAKLAYPGKPWPGYRWLATGDGYIEVPNKPAAVASITANTNVIQATSTVVGGSTVIFNGIKYECPVGSILTINPDGKAVITPYAGTNATQKMGVTVIPSAAPSVSASQSSSSGTITH